MWPLITDKEQCAVELGYLPQRVRKELEEAVKSGKRVCLFVSAKPQQLRKALESVNPPAAK